MKRPPVTDLRGYGRLVADATRGVANVAESLHHAITRVPGPLGTAPAGRTRGITRLVYDSVRAGAWLAGHGFDAALALATPWLPEATSTAQHEGVRAALNGVFGDHLAATGNPLAIPMRFRHAGEPLTLTRAALAASLPQAGARPLVLVHGLCTNDLQWRRNGHDHGTHLARSLGCTPLYLHYNSGRPIATNGAEFAALLETLLQEWPVPVTQLTVIGHSMGGLVARSAVTAARRARHAWPRSLRRLVFLGTPHHGAVLEQLGHWVERALRISPYSAPFAGLGAARSAGITDLRHGVDTRLPRGIECYAIAATLGAHARPARDPLVGDGLVPLDSALGLRTATHRSLDFPPDRQWIARATSHLDLLASAGVAAQLEEWLRG
jgi:hypothetical protein